MTWEIQIVLLSEAMLSNGQSVPGEVDLEVLHDEYGFPYYSAKTLKGHWREQTEFAARALSYQESTGRLGNSFNNTVIRAFGKESLLETASGMLHLSDAVIMNSVRAPFLEAVEQKDVNKHIYPKEIFHSLTDERYFTSIDAKTGTAKKSSLRRIRVVNKGLILHSELFGMENFNTHEQGLLTAGIAAIQSIGMMKSRGKGSVSCSLIHNGIDMTNTGLDNLRKWVKQI